MTLRKGLPRCVFAVVLSMAPQMAAGQVPPSPPGATSTTSTQPAPGAPAAPTTPPILTIFTVPDNASVRLQGDTDINGHTPLDLPPTVTGQYSITITGAGFARTQGVIVLPPRGSALPYVLSEPREGSTALFLRGLVNYPGVPDMISGRPSRGVTMAIGASAGLFMAGRAHLFYRDRLDEVGDFARDRAENERHQRNDWLAFTAAMWGMSAIDYWTRPRIDLSETTPIRLTLDVPKADRVGAVWRSLLVPGAGQEFGNHKTRSIVWLGATMLGGAGYVAANYLVDRGETEVKWTAIKADSAGPTERPKLLLQLEQQQRDLDASKNVRRGFVIATVAAYGLNIIDAMIMPLSPPEPKHAKVASLEPILEPGTTGLALNIRF